MILPKDIQAALSICNKGSPIERQLEMGVDTVLDMFLHTYVNVQVHHHQPTKIELEQVSISGAVAVKLK